MAAKYIQRILAGANPKDLPVETVDKFIWSSTSHCEADRCNDSADVLARADKVIRENRKRMGQRAKGKKL